MDYNFIFNTEQIINESVGTSNICDFIAVGDLSFKGEIENKYKPADVDRIFKDCVFFFNKADIILANLESVFSTIGSPDPEVAINIRANPIYIETLKKFNNIVVACANNHTLNYGRTALQENNFLLRKNNINFIGVGDTIEDAARCQVLEIKNIRIGLYSYFNGGGAATADAAGVNTLTLSDISNIIPDLRRKLNLDILIISRHWGAEFSDYPLTSQIIEGHSLIDNGADIIVGHGPHVVQGIEVYKGKLIAYSLGNFLYDEGTQGIPLERGRWALMLNVKFTKNGIYSFKLIPLVLEKDGYPSLYKKGNFKYNKFENHFNKINYNLNTKKKFYAKLADLFLLKNSIIFHWKKGKKHFFIKIIKGFPVFIKYYIKMLLKNSYRRKK